MRSQDEFHSMFTVYLRVRCGVTPNCQVGSFSRSVFGRHKFLDAVASDLAISGNCRNVWARRSPQTAQLVAEASGQTSRKLAGFVGFGPARQAQGGIFDLGDVGAFTDQSRTSFNRPCK